MIEPRTELKYLAISKQFYFDTQVGGRQDKLAWTAYPHPCN